MSECNRALSAHNRRYSCCLQVGNSGPKQDKEELRASSSQEDWLPPAHPPKGQPVGLSTTLKASAAGGGGVPVQKACPVCAQAHPAPLWAAAAKSLQSCLTLCDPIDGSPPDSSVPGILQASTLEWVAISLSSA